MFIVFIHIICALLLGLLLLAVIQVVGKKTFQSRNKNTPFECGFDPKDSARLPFSIRFFLLAVIFLIFDIEVALLFPFILRIKVNLVKYSITARAIFLIILIFGLIHE